MNHLHLHLPVTTLLNTFQYSCDHSSNGVPELVSSDASHGA